MNIAIYVLYMFPIMLVLCVMLSMTHYAQNYAGIIGGSLLKIIVISTNSSNDILLHCK